MSDGPNLPLAQAGKPLWSSRAWALDPENRNTCLPRRPTRERFGGHSRCPCLNSNTPQKPGYWAQSWTTTNETPKTKPPKPSTCKHGCHSSYNLQQIHANASHAARPARPSNDCSDAEIQSHAPIICPPCPTTQSLRAGQICQNSPYPSCHTPSVPQRSFVATEQGQRNQQLCKNHGFSSARCLTHPTLPHTSVKDTHTSPLAAQNMRMGQALSPTVYRRA
jgi:hypothetical protein